MTALRALPAGRRRRVKVRKGHLGPLLCWAVVFADIGTSVYYVPGILAGHFGTRSTLFVLMTLAVFVLLTVKYSEIAWRYPEGGGVVTVASRGLHPFAGLLGGLFILVDYYLTAALSALSGMYYLAVVLPALHSAGAVMVATVGALVLLGLLNLVGIKESAVVSAAFAMLAALGQLAVTVVVVAHLGVAGVLHSFAALGHGPPLGPAMLLTGYGAAFLAFSGLESITQISPAMIEPRRRTSVRAMLLVLVTMAITSPLLTLFATTQITDPGADPNQFVSILGLEFSGPALGAYVAISGSLLLVFASNTAIIGAYHVFLALTRMGFLPRALESRNRLRRTPHWAIVAAVVLPIALVVVAGGSADFLGDLYAFGLLGAFALSCLSLDVVRWSERWRDPGWRGRAGFALGVLTTVLVLVGWAVNLVAKPLATEFGGGLTCLGIGLGLATYFTNRRHRPAVFPVPFDHAAAAIRRAYRNRAADLLVVLPRDPEDARGVLDEAVRVDRGRPVVFLYRGSWPEAEEESLREVQDPYLRDYTAQDAFARAERFARKAGIRSRRFVYIPGVHRREVVGDVWRAIHPAETLAGEAEYDVLPPIALDRVRRRRLGDQTVLHMFTGRLGEAAR